MRSESELEARLSALEAVVAGLTDRLRALERGAPASPGATAASIAEAPGTDAESAAMGERLAGVPALVGRTCLVLCGAFVVRALTEANTISAALGVTLGILYAAVWLVLAERAAARAQQLSGAFHAAASALIVYPLVAEATLRFALLAPPAAAALLAVATAAGLFVAWRRAFHVVAWITEIAALVTGGLLLMRTRAVLPFALLLLGLAVASLLLAYGRGWRGQRWLVALGLDLVVLLLGVLYGLGARRPEWLALEAVLFVQLGLVIVYLSAFVLRLLVQERFVTPFATVQTVLVLGLGFEGALALAGAPARRAIAFAALASGVVLHVVLARRSEARRGHGAAVGYFTSLATFLSAESLRVLLAPALYPVLWAAAAVVVATIARPGARPFLRAHAALLAFAAAVASGLLAASLGALALPAARAWPAWSVSALAVLALTALAAALLYGGNGERHLPVAVASRSLALVVALLGVGGWLVHAARPLWSAAAADPGRLAVARTAVLAAAALALAAAAAAWRRSPAPREVGRLAVLVLALGGLKLLAEDLRAGRAATLVFSLALYGAVLIAVPALLRRSRAGSAATASQPAPLEPERS